MLEGTEVLWPEKEPYLALQEKLLALGRTAFFKEKQNSPIRDGSQMFDTAQWRKFTARDGEIAVLMGSTDSVADDVAIIKDNDGGKACGVVGVSGTRDACAPRAAAQQASDSAKAACTDDLKYFGFLDPAVGKSTGGEGDYAAIVTVGKAPDGTIYVMDVWMDRASPMKQVEQVFALHDRYNYQKFGFESNGFQETLGTFIQDVQTRRRRTGRKFWLPVERLNNRHSKHSRISLLEPHILAGNIVFKQDLRQAFYAQADEYTGTGLSHDDGLDALASCVEMVRGIEKPISHVKTVGRRISARSGL